MESLGIINSLAEKSVLGNSLLAWLSTITASVVLFLALKLLQGVIENRISRLAEKKDSPLLKLSANLISKTTRLFVFLIAFWASVSIFLSLSAKAVAALNGMVLALVFVQMALWGNALIDHEIRKRTKQAEEKDISRTSGFTAIRLLLKTTLWTIILLLILDNFGVNVTSLVAGLGIGGIAIALAVQNILGDLLCSVSILLDEPFRVGDFIIVDDKLGVVEKIGIKSTRVKSLSGEQLIFSNSDLIGSRIRNFKKMEERRVPFSLGVVYSTPAEKLELIPTICRETIEQLEQTRFDRAHFKSFGPYSLDFEIVYYVLDPDYNIFMDIQQQINLTLFKRFAEQGIEFAYPTQTIMMTQEQAHHSG